MKPRALRLVLKPKRKRKSETRLFYHFSIRGMMVQKRCPKAILLLAVVSAFSLWYVNCKDLKSLEIQRNSLSKEGSQFETKTFRSPESRLDNGTMKRKVTPLNYDDTFAYGCLHDIPIPNTTLDTAFTPQQERDVIMEIFNQTAGHNWYNKTHWGNESVSHCLWYGITCDRDTSRYIISIFLSKNNLVGTLPRSLWKLRNLQGLCIGANKGLTGNLSDILSANMTSVLRLNLGFNKLFGTIPGDILVKMKSLVKIHLCCQIGKGLNGEIPKDIGNLTELQVLSLGQNILHGPIPKSIGKLKMLWFLDLETATYLSNGFENLYHLSSLRYMHLSLAGLNGTLPDDFGLYFPAMHECLLPGNNFTGRIPSTMGNMTNLRQFNLARNRFSGTIPKSIGLIPMLQIVDFSGNKLISLEEGIKFNSTSLEVLLLARNKNLTWTLDALLDAMESTKESLRIVNINECNFVGTIPEKLWDFKNLISLDLRNNNLSGRLPWSYGNLFFLHDIDISGNNLSGLIPERYEDLPSLNVLDISKNPFMHGTDKDIGTLPNYMTADFTTLTRRNPSDNFKCPNARLNYNNGLVKLDPSYYHYRLCICDVGYYGSGKTCLPCMEGARCKDHMLPVQNMVIKAGFWPSSRGQNVTHLVHCSHVLGTSPHVNTSCNPKGTCECWIEWVKEKSSGSYTVCNKSCVCLKGSKDRFCSLCEDGYYKQGIRCYACHKSETSVYILAALSVVTMLLLIVTFLLYERKRFLSAVFVFSQIVLLIVLAMFNIIPAWLLELNTIVLFVGLAERGKAARGILKIGLFYLQTLDALISNNDIWPVQVLETQRYISNVFNFHFSGLACAFPQLFTPLGELKSLMLLPPICITVIWFYYGLGCLACVVLRHPSVKEKRFRLRNSCLQLSIVSLNLTYFPIVKKTASVLARCGEDNGYHYLREAPWMECKGHAYTTLQLLAWIALVFYVFGVPFGVFLPLLRMNNVATRDQLPQQEQETLDSWLGSIYLPYKKEFRSYFEIMFLVRRMLIAFSLSFITRASSFQTIAVCLVLLVALCFQLFFRPLVDNYRKFPLENTTEALVLLTLHFSFMNIRYAAQKPNTSAPIIWMIVIVNLLLFCGIVVAIILLLGRVHVVKIPLVANQRAGDDEPAPIHPEDSPLSVLTRNGPEEQYGTFDDAQNGDSACLM